MVKDIESFKTQLQFLRFSNLRALQERHIEIVQTWAVEKSPPRRSKLPQLFVAETPRVEVSLPVTRIGVCQHRPARRIVRHIHWCCIRSNQRIVIILA